MGWIDTLTDVFTGNPAKDAAAQQRAYLAQQQAAGQAAINTGLTNATGAVTAGTAAARPILQGGFDTARTDVGAGTDAALGTLQQGTTAAMGHLGGAFAPLSALGEKYGGATSLQLDALGANGPEGLARAKAAFEASPGYQFQLDQGIEGITRQRNAMGMGASGNAMHDAIKYASGLAGQEYKDWRSSLGNYINPELLATSGYATGVGTKGADLLYGAGKEGAGYEAQRGGMLADLAKQYGIAGAGLETSQGNTLAGLHTGAAGQTAGMITGMAQPYAKTYGDEAAAQMGGSANFWGLGQNIASLAAGQFGRGGGGGGGGGGGSTLYTPPPNAPWTGR